MDDPTELPIIYTTTVLTSRKIAQIPLRVENPNEHYLIEDLLFKTQVKKSTYYLIGVIPKTDFDNVDNVIGTVGNVRSIKQIDLFSKEFVLTVQGIQCFLLGETISEERMKITKITVIEEPYLPFLGDENKHEELKAEFEKILTDFYKFTNFGKMQPFNGDIKAYFKKYPTHKIIKNCLNNIIYLTQVDSYEVIQATSLDELIKIVINLLKRLIVEDGVLTTLNKSSITPIPFELPPDSKPTLRPISVPSFSFIIDSLNGKKHGAKKKLSPEVQELSTALLNSNMPTHINDLVLKDLTRLEKIHHFSSEYSILISYLNYVINLPWNKTTKETLDLQKAKIVLDKYHYGMYTVKTRILQFIAAKMFNPDRRGPILCFIGPPGVGKTSIVKSIANTLNRTFKRVSLGGINCYSEIKGHRKTYIGSMPGSIMQAINESQTKNPLILLDEIDKMCKGSSGDPAAALLEVLDPEQNTSFVDSYVNLPFDLSQVMFVATANNVNLIHSALRDRLEIIYLDGYTQEEKVLIAENYIIPKTLKDYKMDELQITIFKNTINDIITKHTCEVGVRELQRKIETICHYIAVKIIENENEKTKNFLITPDSLIDILGIELSYDTKETLVKQSSDRIGVAIGLAWTSVGSKVQMIEACESYSNNRKNDLILTGLVGKTLKESVQIAFSWTIEFAKKNQLNKKDFSVHVHLPVGGHKKDGSSAGITIVCALTSLFWKIPLKSMVAMTGEISLQGHVLPVGSVKQKLYAAYYANIKTVIIPEKNIKDTKDLPKYISEGINIIPVKSIEDVLEIVFPGGLSFFQNPTTDIVLKSKI